MNDFGTESFISSPVNYTYGTYPAFRKTSLRLVCTGSTTRLSTCEKHVRCVERRQAYMFNSLYLFLRATTEELHMFHSLKVKGYVYIFSTFISFRTSVDCRSVDNLQSKKTELSLSQVSISCMMISLTSTHLKML